MAQLDLVSRVINVNKCSTTLEHDVFITQLKAVFLSSLMSINSPDVRTIHGLIISTGNVEIGRPIVLNGVNGITYQLIFVVNPEIHNQILRLNGKKAYVVGLYSKTKVSFSTIKYLDVLYVSVD